MQKTEELIRIRRKALFFLRGNNSTNEPEVYGFKPKNYNNNKTAPFNEWLFEFEMDLFNKLNNISFQIKKRYFQKRLD